MDSSDERLVAYADCLMRLEPMLGGPKQDKDMQQDRAFVSFDAGISWVFVGYRPHTANTFLSTAGWHTLNGPDKRTLMQLLLNEFPGVVCSIPLAIPKSDWADSDD